MPDFGEEYFGEENLGVGPSVVTPNIPQITLAWRYTGNTDVPQDVRRRRQQVVDMMLRLGTPVLAKKLYTIEDVNQGVAERSVNYSRTYGQSRHNDPISHGAGFASIVKSPNEWISPDGRLVVASSSPGNDYQPAPLYRGYGPGYLMFVIQPDAIVDTYKLSPTGALIKTQDATGQAPWFPTLHDNDLFINVEIDREGNITSTQERYQLKQVSPISFRGTNRRGANETDVNGKRGDSIGGNRFVVNQTFHMNLVPSGTDSEIYEVETDR